MNRSHHSWGVKHKVLKGGIASHRINAFVFAGLNDLNNVVVARLLQLKVNTQKFSRDAGAGIRVGLGKAFFVVEIVVVPTVLLSFAIDKDEGMRFILLCMALSPVVDNGDDPVGHGKGCDRAWFFDFTSVDIKIFLSALAIAV